MFLLAAGMLVLSWGRSADVLVDFGHELYVAWQLGEGKQLGQDIAWAANTGPLSPHLNALLFAVFGLGVSTLAVFNVLLLAILTTALFRIVRALSDCLSATVACLVFLLVFAFGQYDEIANYNYVTPYSHGITHGFLLSLLAIVLLFRRARNGDGASLVGSGLCLGLVFLTKPEIFVACLAALGLGLAHLFSEARGSKSRTRLLLLFAAAAMVGPLAALLLLLMRLAPMAAWRATAVPWLVLATPVTRTPFYLWCSGLDQPGQNLALLVSMLVWYAALFYPAALLDARLPWRGTALQVAAVMAFVVVVVLFFFAIPLPFWYHVARPLPVVILVGCGAYAMALFRTQRSDPSRPCLVLGLMMSAFALMLLLKIVLRARINHYGFVLAMPATVLFVTWLMSSIPSLLRSRGGSGALFRAVALGAIVVFAGVHVKFSADAYARKTYPVGSGRDAFLADSRGAFVSEIVQRIVRSAAPGGTLAVLPEGVMINYLARRSNPSPYLTYLPDAIAVFGEENLLASYRRSPPDLILVVQRDASEHGAPLFGRDYARTTAEWLFDDYVPVSRLGGSPFERGGYGMLLFARRATVAPTREGGPAGILR